MSSSSSGKPTTSSFFSQKGAPSQPSSSGPSTSAQPNKRSTVVDLTLTDSDDDDLILPDIQIRPTKKVKTEPSTQSASTSTPAPASGAPAKPPLAPIFQRKPPAASTSVPKPSIARPSSALERRGPSESITKWRFDPSQAESSSRAGSEAPSQAAIRPSAASGSRLLGRNLLAKQRTSYLQPEHYLAANGEEVIGTGRVADEGAGSGEDGADEGEDSDDDDDQPQSTAKSTSKGKGKATEPDSPPLGGSRLARFAHKPAAKPATKVGTVSATGVKYTPLEQQVLALQAKHPGVLLMFEVGYKFKFFGDDAKFASRVLGIACFKSKSMMTASVPTHRLTVHTKRLLNAGAKVGVVRQIETAALKKIGNNKSAPFTREMTHLYTNATYVDELSVDPLEHGGVTATLLCVVEEAVGKGKGKEKGKAKEEDGDEGDGQSKAGKVQIGLVAVLPSTGEVIYDSFEDSYTRAELETRLLHLQPSELLLQEGMTRQTESMLSYVVDHDVSGTGKKTRVDRITKRRTANEASTYVSSFYTKLKSDAAEVSQADVMTIDDDDEGTPEAAPGALHAVLDLPPLVLVALASLIAHLKPFKLESVLAHSNSFTHFSQRGAMMLNANTLASLEILQNQTDYKLRGSLLSVLDRTQSSFGRRLLRRWVTKPLVSIPAIQARQEAVQELLTNSGAPAVAGLRTLFHGLPDIERGLVRIALGQATPLELLRTLEAFRRVSSFSPKESDKQALRSGLLKSIVGSLSPIKDKVEAFLAQIDPEMARKGLKEHLFREPVPEDVQDAQDCLSLATSELDAELIEVRRILKRPRLEFMSVAQEDFLIEVKIADAKKVVPDNWVKINSTKQAYRYRTPAIIRKMDELEQCKERLAAAAKDAYQSFLRVVAEEYDNLRYVVLQVATADVLFALASVALTDGYCPPKFVDEPGMVDITNGRHPILETLQTTPVVPNSIKMGGGEPRQIVLTGLNMGGKSSLSRMVALIVLMAQLGSYVPAEACTLGLFDSVYTRMGASDEIGRGRSTFMVEMSETSEILKLATPRSLIILDELGRGTSTNDGQAIASAVLETIVTKTKALTLFVTHYPGLADIAKRFPEQVGLKHMASHETGRTNGFPQLVFLYKLISGVASSSHGLNVAALAGLPQSVLVRARDKSQEAERTEQARLLQRRSDRVATILRVLAAREAVPPTATQAPATAPTSDNPAAEDDEPTAEAEGAVAPASQLTLSRERLLELCEIVLNQA